MPVDKDLVERLMRLFQGNQRGCGYGDGAKGIKWDDKKNKWDYDKANKAVGWRHRPANYEDFKAHLEGQMALGIGPILDDGTTYRVEIDIDHIGDAKYEIDYPEEMAKLKKEPLPWVVNRTKSGGMRIIMFFREPVPAEMAIRYAQQVCARNGWAGNEIFPKQTQLAEKDDAPSWTYVGYGPTHGKFAEQCGMDYSGNPLTLEEYIKLCEKSLVSRDQLASHVTAQDQTKSEASAKTRKTHGGGKWVVEESVEATITAMFCNGPTCQWDIARQRSTVFQHNFLFNVAIFLKRKYSENWPEALAWVNYNVLSPPGDAERLKDLVRDITKKDYEYRCKDEPICSHCNPYACRNMRFGVGSSLGMEDRELAMVIWNSDPQTFVLNVGERRVHFTAQELVKMEIYRIKCLESGADIPPKMKQEDWDRRINNAKHDALVVDPPDLLRTDANEIEVLQSFFSIHVPSMVRTLGNEFLAGRVGDSVRVRMEERRFYLKWQALMNFCRRALSMHDKELTRLRLFLAMKGESHSRTDGRDWYRSTWSVPMSMFDVSILDRWFDPEGNIIDGPWRRE